MKKCFYCGKDIEDNAAFCPYCGVKANINPSAPASAPAQSAVINGEKEGHSALGITAFILSFFFSTAGLICGIIDIAVNKNRRHGLSIAAIIISIVKIILSAILSVIIFINFGRPAVEASNEIIEKLPGYIDSAVEPKVRDSGIDIVLPDTPVTVNQYGFDGDLETVCKITEIKREGSSGILGASLTVTVEMVQNNTSESRTYADITYKIINEEGVTVDTSELMVGPMSQGEKMKDDIYLFNLKEPGKYTLVFEDYRD